MNSITYQIPPILKQENLFERNSRNNNNDNSNNRNKREQHQQKDTLKIKKESKHDRILVRQDCGRFKTQ